VRRVFDVYDGLILRLYVVSIDPAWPRIDVFGYLPKETTGVSTGSVGSHPKLTWPDVTSPILETRFATGGVGLEGSCSRMAGLDVTYPNPSETASAFRESQKRPRSH
jgi:hypothetical protein